MVVIIKIDDKGEPIVEYNGKRIEARTKLDKLVKNFLYNLVSKPEAKQCMNEPGVRIKDVQVDKEFNLYTIKHFVEKINKEKIVKPYYYITSYEEEVEIKSEEVIITKFYMLECPNENSKTNNNQDLTKEKNNKETKKLFDDIIKELKDNAPKLKITGIELV